MTKVSLKRLVLSGLFAALTTVATLISIPLPFGYANLGDLFVILCGVILGPVYGSLAAGIGAALSDLVLGYGLYAPVTFLIKGIMAVIVWLFARDLTKKFFSLRFLIGSFLAELFMIAGYLGFELIVYGKGAFASIPGNTIQAAVCFIAAIVIFIVLRKTKLLDKLKK